MPMNREEKTGEDMVTRHCLLKLISIEVQRNCLRPTSSAVQPCSMAQWTGHFFKQKNITVIY